MSRTRQADEPAVRGYAVTHPTGRAVLSVEAGWDQFVYAEAFVPPRDPTALGHALRTTLASPLRRQISTIAGVDRVHARFAWNHVVTEIVHTYRKASGHEQDDIATAS